MKESLKIHGFTRVQIEESGKIIGDSGFVGPNQIVNDGFLEYLCHTIGASAGSKQVGFVALGTGTAPGATTTGLDGEIMSSTQRKAVTYAAVGSTTAQFTATFASSDSFLTPLPTLVTLVSLTRLLLMRPSSPETPLPVQAAIRIRMSM